MRCQRHDAGWRAEYPAQRIELVAEGQERAAAQVGSAAVAGAIILPGMPVRQILTRFGTCAYRPPYCALLQ